MNIVQASLVMANDTASKSSPKGFGANIARDPSVDALLTENAPVAIGVSGGKDSQAAALATFRYLDEIGHSGTRILIHSDLGTVEWNDSLRVCEDLADHLQCDLVVVRRKAGGLMERWESRWLSSKTRYQTLSTVTLVPCWSTPSMRFCTSEQKTHPIVAELKRRFKDQRIINVTGVRREESRPRSRMSVSDFDSSGRILNWRSIIDLTTDDVFSLIDESGLLPHPAYRDFGMSRVSCRFCIMSNLSDLTAATAQKESHDLYRRMVQLEIDSSFAFQGARWLGDLAPHLLSEEMRSKLTLAKERAILRKKIEGQITKSMLYVKGWPTRMLSDEEAGLLAKTRQQISQFYNLECDFLTVEGIHHRYAELMQKHASQE
jgi:3'-phosphoadenosine 5'-phosphosulfate sulfotransferase (PAPS reductase)/FAD synthetase